MGIKLKNKRRRRRRSYADYKPRIQKPHPRSDPFRVVFYLVAIGVAFWVYFNQDTVRALLLGEVPEINLPPALSEFLPFVEADEIAEEGLPSPDELEGAGGEEAEPDPTLLPEIDGSPGVPPGELARQGELAYQDGDLDAAIAFYGQAADLSPNAVEYHVQVARLLLFRSATEYESSREATLEAALEAADHAVLANPERPEGYAIKAMALDWTGNPERAASLALLALEYDPNYAVAHAYYAEALVDLDRWDQSLEEVELAAELAPDNLDIRRNYAYVLESLGDYNGAALQYEQAIALHPQLVFLRLALGRTYRASDRINDAIDQFLTAEQLDPENALSAVELGWTYQAFLGDEASALDYYQHASQLDETYTRPWERIGTMRYARGDYEDAALAFERALLLGGDDLNVRLQLGLSYANSGECTEAIENLTAARQLADGDERTDTLIQSGFDMCAYDVLPVAPDEDAEP